MSKKKINASKPAPGFERLMSKLLVGAGIPRDDVTVDALPKGQALRSFTKQWCPKIISAVEDLQEALQDVAAPRARLMTFERRNSAELQWDFADVNYVSIDSTLDFTDLQALVDESNAKYNADSVSVWIVPGTNSVKGTSLYIRMDAVNHFMLIHFGNQTGKNQIPDQEIAGDNAITAMGCIHYANHLENIAHWMALVDAFTADFTEGAKDDIQQVFKENAIETEVTAGFLDSLSAKVFNSERFIQLMMDAGRMHAHALMCEAQTLVGSIAALKSENLEKLQEVVSQADAERARERKRAATDVENINLSLKGARELSNRLQSELQTAHQKLREQQAKNAAPQDSRAHLHAGFRGLFLA